MHLIIRDELPFVAVTIVHRGASIAGVSMLVDSGSASTILSADVAAEVGIVPQPGDRLRRLRGVGGHEVVFTRHVERIEAGGRGLDGFELEIGAMEYGFDIGGILGMDFLRGAGAILNLRDLTFELS
jgi:hypothetical protein